MPRLCFWLLLCGLTLAAPARAAEDYADYQGTLSFDNGKGVTVFKDLPRFEDYPAEHAPRRVAKDIDFTSNREARKYRTRLRQGLAEGPNFNGHYNVVIFGCGSGCQYSKIVDIETGRVTDGWETQYAVGFRKNSSLIVPDMPAGAAPRWDEYCHLGETGLRFYTLSRGHLKRVKSLSLDAAWKGKRSGPCADL